MSNLTERPPQLLGPYNVVELLRPRNDSRHILSIYTVAFRQRRELVGLDMMDNMVLRECGPVYFMGTLKLTDENKICLTERGRQRLRQDLLRRFGREGEIRFNSQKFKAKVKVWGELFAEPRGLDSSVSFTIVARDTSTMVEHEFRVRSLHARSYALSREYLAKWKLLREIISITNDNKKTPVGERTPGWFVSKYLEANSEYFNEMKEDDSLGVRHVHRAEVYNMLAEHHQWLREKITKLKLLNKHTMSEFAKEAGRIRKNETYGECDDLEQRWRSDELVSDREEEVNESVPMDAEDIIYENDYQHTYQEVGGKRAVSEDRQMFPEDEEFAMDTRPEVLAAVPEELLYHEPVFPAGSRWYCPAFKCDYCIILREAYLMDFKWMSNDDRNFLRSGLWCPTTDRAVELFNDAVEDHFYQHLRKAGIKHVARRFRGRDAMGNPQFETIELNGPRQVKPEYDRFRFEWINPNHH